MNKLNSFEMIKISVFIWRALRGWLPVDLSLKKKGITLVSKCQCCANEETISHVLISGTLAAAVWAHFYATMGILNGQHVRTVLGMLNFWRNSGDFCVKGHLRLLLPQVILYFLWLARNNGKHEDVRVNTKQVIFQVKEYINLWSKAYPISEKGIRGDMDVAVDWRLRLRKSKMKPPKIIVWQPPTSGYKLNVDGAYSHIDGRAGGGGIVRDGRGEFCVAFSASYDGIDSALMAELLALRDGLQMCMDRGYTELQIDCDSQLTTLLLRKSIVHWRFAAIRSSILQLLQHLNATVNHIYREANQVADMLAYFGLVNGQGTPQTMQNLPHAIKVQARRDQLGECYVRQ